MSRQNQVLLNISGGEISPEMYGRIDLPIYQKGNQRVQNYIVLSQGGLRYRNSTKHVHNTRGLATGRLISFAFNESDTYVIEFTNQKLRFYRNFGAILNSATITITGVNKAAIASVSATAHGLSNDQEIYITGIVGMIELNNQSFIVKNATANAFDLADIYGNAVNSTNFNTYVSGGTIATPYEISAPYLAAHIPDLHYDQSADTLIITHQQYAPFKLTRTGHTSWTIATFVRTADPFNQKIISGITQANPGVFTTSTNHGFVVDDEVFIAGVVGMTQVNYNRYLINSTPAANTFTVKLAGTPVNTTGFTAYSSGGIVIRTKDCPKTIGFLDSSRAAYGNTVLNPAGLWISRAPSSSTGATRFDDFTTGSNATDAILYTLTPIFRKQDSVQWINMTNKQIIIGCANSIRRLHGDTIDDPISPSSISAKPISNIGSAGVQSFSSGQSMFYVDYFGNKIQSFLFSIQSDDFVTVNQNLTSSQLGAFNFTEIAQQRGDSGLLWVLRADGVLLGMTFSEVEQIFGWHRHYLGGASVIDSVARTRAKVISIAVEPRSGAESVLWMLIERKIGVNTYRSVEYLTSPVRFVEIEDFFTASGFEAQGADVAKYVAAVSEQLKATVHVDSATSYDGSALSTTVTMDPSATTGTSITITASGAFFTSAMVGQEIWKKYDIAGNGGGRAKITGFTSSTLVTAKVLVDFDNADVIPAGSWFLTVGKAYGMLHLVGQTLALQCDGAPEKSVVVASDGSVTLPYQSSKVHAGYKYLGLSMTLNLDVGGDRGSGQAKIRKILEIIPRFAKTIGAKIGTTIWNAKSLIFKDVIDVTDRPTELFDGVLAFRPSDSWSRDTKQAVIMQDIPSPQTLLSLDIMVETADD